ncbi:N-6 DNA methylase [Pseudoflavitalea sp. X16]|uniref:N-6 DNA methylase n=1 Tax=Paraflavitalea devenefica TaxID=2716334 RepID=UPI001421C84E|nr:N-6 DNA methylase [Paraflavitalea devenefica]NII25164.1 N-6 DNA methylase [Paraflavitalea devenefica]
MLDTQTKRRIDDCRDILVGKLPDPKAQIEQITIGLIYKFMDDMDKEAVELGGQAKFFSDYKVPDPEFPNNSSKDKVVEFSKYAWDKLMHPKVTAIEMLTLYSEAIEGMEKNPNIPQLFRDIFNNAYLPYRDPETLKLFLKTIGEFEYTHSEKLGDAFEYLLSVMGSQGDAGQFRTPRHIIDFLVAIIDPDKTDTILDPACGTAGFLISAYKHILLKYSKDNRQGLNIYEYNKLQNKPFNNLGDQLTPDDRKKLIQNFVGYDISPDMVRLSLVNLYLHGFNTPKIHEYDTLSSEERWRESFDVVLANPPFMSPKGGIRPHKKFTISSNRSEVLFVDYIAEHLNPRGKAGIIVPEGIIFQSGTAYKDLRKMLVENHLYAVVSLPAGVFNPYSGVKTSILLMDKEVAKKREEILFIKIDNDGYNLGAQRTAVKGGQLEEAIKVTQKFFETGEFEETSIAHLVPKAEIAKNRDFNLSGERYKTIQDLSGTAFDIVKIGDVFKTSSGGTPLKDKEEYYKNGNIPWLRSGEVAQGFITSSELYITEEGLKNSSAKIFPINTVLVAMYGATAGQVGILKFEASTNQAVCGILPNDKAIPEYLYLILKSQKDYLISLSGGGAQPNISQTIIRDLQIPLPPLSIQEEIVAEIEDYQKIIDGAKAVVANYKPKIDIDPNWGLKKMGDISEFKNGLNFTKSSSGELIKVFGVGNFKNHLIAPLEDLEVVQINENLNDNYLLQKGDILFVRSNGNKDLVGRSVVIPEVNERISFSGFTIRCRLQFDIEPLFIGYLLKSDFHSKLMKTVGQGANIRNLSQGILNDIEVPIPPREIQIEIANRLNKEQDLVNANKQLIEIFEQKIKDKIAKVWGETL